MVPSKIIQNFIRNNKNLLMRNLHLHEYQCKTLLRENGINTQRYILFDDKTKNMLRNYDFKYVVKAQILAGGRGKGIFKDGYIGGVHLCKNKDIALSVAQRMLNNTLVTKQTGKDGIIVKKVMIAEALDIQEEKYLAIILDSLSNSAMIICSPVGGMDIEDIAQKFPNKVLKLPVSIDIDNDIQLKAKTVAKFLEFNDKYINQCEEQIVRLFQLFKSIDCTQIEINPFAVATNSDDIVCFDCKINIDDNAEYRQSKIFEMEDKSQLNTLEVRAKSMGLNYILMDGNIACVVNGAGLAMATMDLLNCYGAKAANFLDLGGRVTVRGVVEALDIVLCDNKVDRIFVNIFGGIVNCATIAEGILEYCFNKPNLPKMIVRLEGNQSEFAKKLIKDSSFSLNIQIAHDLGDAAEKICQ